MRWIVFWVALLPLSAGAQLPDFTALVRGEAAAVVNIFRAAVEKTLPGDAVALLVLRSGSRAFIPLRIP